MRDQIWDMKEKGEETNSIPFLSWQLEGWVCMISLQDIIA